MKILYLVIHLILFLGISYGCKNKVSEKCNTVCTFSLQCVTNNINPIFLKSKMIDDFKIQCYSTCTMLQDEFMSCYDTNRNSCNDYYTCILNSGLFN